jgi:hypothetical protein
MTAELKRIIWEKCESDPADVYGNLMATLVEGRAKLYTGTREERYGIAEKEMCDFEDGWPYLKKEEVQKLKVLNLSEIEKIRGVGKNFAYCVYSALKEI